ncbi:lateral flagellin LafA [Oceanimonas sp. CHS3-5]|uniref:lateral flagellin LafA n=1 Tax=Oceanimonas sp. CHS3-5 TaxID=3068186 RepID=UPI00273E8A1C|nr:lateral flagellin LafA [Oceanimonas sp. CHS3-5]MDP5292378.1 lateral flagellin LafA [Oceanimonas sp. CHS3-5]
MGLSIHTNYTALVTQNTLNSTNKMLGTAMERLGTGFRINSAADDAAGLQIATRLQAQSNGMSVAMRNSQDAISLLQTAEGSFDEMTNIVQRMKDLSTQAANDTNSADDRKALSAEFNELGKELANVMTNTQYAGEALFDVAGTGGKFGTAGGMTFQIGSSSAEAMTMDVSTEVGAVATALGALNAQFAAAPAADAKLETQAGASGAIDLANTALDAIGTVRAQFGANMNRLEHTINNLSNMRENNEAAKGRIMDADFAQEASSMSKNQMLMQSGMSVLSNANQMSGLVMSLLR